jgi:hypothetical protein
MNRPRIRPFRTWTGSDDGLEKHPLDRVRIFERNNRSKHFIEVYIWKTIGEVRAVKRWRTRNCLAFWHGWKEVRTEPDKKGRIIASRKLGEIHLANNRLSYNTIVHECYHATREFVARNNIEEYPRDADRIAAWDRGDFAGEERAAEFIGLIADWIIHRVHRLPSRKNK